MYEVKFYCTVRGMLEGLINTWYILPPQSAFTAPKHRGIDNTKLSMVYITRNTVPDLEYGFFQLIHVLAGLFF